MSHLSELRRFRKITTKALAQYPLSNIRIDFIDYAENAVYKITTREGMFLLRIHANHSKTAEAIEQELQYIILLRENGFDLQKPLKSLDGEYIVHIDDKMISVLSWQIGTKKFKSINDRHFELLGHYLAKMHSFSIENKHRIVSSQREYWTADNLVGSSPIFGSFAGLKNIKGFDKQIFEAARLQTLGRLQKHYHENPEKFGMIHADLHFNNILWQGENLLPIDFDDCGIGSYFHDLSIPIVTTNSQKPKQHRDILLTAYGKTHSLTQADIDLIDDYILSRHISNQSWLLMRSNHPKIKKYHIQTMEGTMKVLKAGLK
ncbi:MAG: phosphotransferase [Alphaproteobacteria bacterium]|nr:phosphotransferase [Alphaproteobacteria bacterium]